MKQKLFFLLKVYVFWMILFFILKLLFLVYNYRDAFNLPFSDWLRIFFHGARLDLSAGAYLMFLPAILVLSGYIPKNKLYMKIINIYVFIMLFLIVFLGVADMALYSYWGFRLDLTTVMTYLKTPGEAMASVNISELLLLFLIMGVTIVLFIFFYKKVIRIPYKAFINIDFKTFVTVIFFTLLLILPARGGIGIAPVNLGTAYFHSDRFANHSAINVLWNVIYSLTEKNKLDATFTFMPDGEALELFNKLHVRSEKGSERIIRERANILLIIMESFSGKIIEPLGGEEGITPGFNRLAEEGLLFTNFFANGDRSDKGLVSIFSGFPAQPITSIINYPSRSQKLPFLLDAFDNDGYYTAFYYGGDLDFSNFRSYFTRKSVDQVVDIKSFPRSVAVQKWGVPDNYVYDMILNDLDEVKQAFFLSFFTLSSHEPFDIPGDPAFGFSERDEQSRSAFYFADKCLEVFIEQARQKPWWENTLVIVLSDHGSRSPGNTPNHSREKFAIPMLWIGGALLAEPEIIPVYSSQTDLPATLLNQFGYDYNDFRYSKNIFDPQRCNFAFYSFHNGFGFFTDSVELIYDNSAEKFIHESGNSAGSRHAHGKALLQVLTNDFLSF